MRSLLFKDIKILMKTISVLILLMVGINIIGFMESDGTDMFVGILPVFLTMTIMTVFSYEEQDGSQSMFMTFPTSRKNMVLEKYLLMIILDIVGFIFSILFLIVTKSTDSFPVILIISLIAIVIMSIQLPLLYLLGYQKGRILFFITAALIGGCCGFFATADESDTSMLSGFISNHLVIFMILITIAVFTISFIISNIIFSKKEY
ncbi:MAG: ABC-2 transporter permease [Ruminococcus sp.]|nr:ABC-2 transporter permease [Ruminococcus sp.]